MTTPAGMTVEPIVGRRRELDALRRWLDAARAGAGRLVCCAGDPGIGKTRLAQELAGTASAAGVAVAWGRCAEAEGAPGFWPWRQVLRDIGIDADQVLTGRIASLEERFRIFEDVAEAVCGVAAQQGGLLVVLDDIHWADDGSLLVLRHLADRLDGSYLLVLAAFRDAEPADSLHRVLPGLLRSRATVERLDLRGFDLAEVREQLARVLAADAAADTRAVLDITGGNPLFVREVARAMASGTWRADQPSRTVLDIVAERLTAVSAGCRRMLEAAAVVGRDFPLGLVAAVLGEPVAGCLPLVDEAIRYGLVARTGAGHRFVHALTRDAVEASLTTADLAAMHRAVALAAEAHYAGDLAEHLVEIARHWAVVAPYGDAATARSWAVRAADDAVRSLAYEDGVRLYRSALALDPPTLSGDERYRLLTALGRAAYLAGDPNACADAASAAMELARRAGQPVRMAEAALVVEAAPDLYAAAGRLCDEALAALGDTGAIGLRARLLAQRSRVAFVEGEQDSTESLSSAALELARTAGDDRALAEALLAREEACPGPAGAPERLRLAAEVIAVARRTDSPRTEMWGEIWRIGALLQVGRLAEAAAELVPLRSVCEQVGGPVGGWHFDRVTACVAQAQGRFADAEHAGRRGFERMRTVEPVSSTGRYLALECALAMHIGVTDTAAEFLIHPWDPPTGHFATMNRLHLTFLLLRAGRADEAGAVYQQAGPPEAWRLPALFALPGYVYGSLAAAELGRPDDLTYLLDRLGQFNGAQVTGGNGVVYLGPADLTLGRGAAAQGKSDRAIELLADAADQADRAGAPGFAAEARFHLATTLLTRDDPGDRARAGVVARDAHQQARTLGMGTYLTRTADLVAHLDRAAQRVQPGGLSPREVEVARLVADGLTNRQIADRLVISDRTAENHVQHILRKLGFATRSQIATWSLRSGD
ncbi:helix-turn-helix transcriptional regulator [Kribbella sp. NPDC055110]